VKGKETIDLRRKEDAKEIVEEGKPVGGAKNTRKILPAREPGERHR